MLVRAARRKAQHEALTSLRLQPGPLFLPWLCPAQLRHQQRHRHSSTSSTATPSSRPPPRPTTTSTTIPVSTLRRRHSQSRRRLATAAVETRVFPDEYVPFDVGTSHQHGGDSNYRPLGWASDRPSLAALKEFDPSSPIIINNTLAIPPRRFLGRGGSDSGTAADLHLTLETCLRVGWLDRAASLVRRLSSVYAPGVPELLQAHNGYLRVLVTRVLSTRDEPGFRTLLQWFEVEMRNKQVEPDATTYALLLKASLRMLQPPRLERTVRRYMELATDAGHDVEVLNLPILSDAELYQVTQIFPTEFSAVSDQTSLPWDAESTTPPSPTVAEDPLPELNPMKQKGLGLKSVKQSVALLTKSSMPALQDTTNLSEEQRRAQASERQHQLENDVIASTVDRWKSEADMDKGLWKVKDRARKGKLGARSWEWFEGLQTSIREELRLVEEAVASVTDGGRSAKDAASQERYIYGPFLRSVPVDRLAALTVLTCLNKLCDRSADRGARLSALAISLGSAVEDESEVIATREAMRSMGGERKIRMLKDATELQSLRWSFRRWAQSQGTGGSAGDGRAARASLDRASVEMPHTPWTLSVRAKVGSILISRLMSTAKIPVTRTHPETGAEVTQLQPAFSHGYHHHLGKKMGVFAGNPAVINELKLAPLYIGMVKSLPMIAEPIAWSGFRQGGYYGYRQPVMRVRDYTSTQREHVEVADERGDMDQVWEGLNVLSRTPWRINHAVFKVMTEAWNTGEKIANIPPEHPDLQDPPEPHPTAPDNERRRWMRAMATVQNERSGLQSQRCSQNLQLEIARAFYDETFYFPHNVDFRGRAYPIPPHFNHMGADHCRGLLLFAEEKELGASGLRWLKIHLANMYGFDKASFSEREAFTLVNLPKIYDSATDPLGGERWWLSAEDPWQFLATCIELKAALDSADPVAYRSRLPVHQDGTCNGLQHYAALGGDMAGARQVNLEPGDRPADVYTGVAELVKQEIAADAAAGDAIARLLEGRVTRKVVKQTVMTNVYGVTFVGAAAQVRARLAETIPAEVLERHDTDLNRVSRYVAKKIFRSLGSLFGGAHDIQYWLTECANRIGRALTPEQIAHMETSDPATGKRVHSTVVTEAKFRQARRRIELDHSQFKLPVTWTTPLKMPVVQPYRAARMTRVVTAIQGMSINQPTAACRIDRRKQLQGFPPNFIHSLDATHMFLSALKSHELGLTFASVHDSFWTHARDVDCLARVLRDAFIRMHSEDIIGRLAAEFQTRYKGCYYLASVPGDSPVGREIRAWRSKHRARKQGKYVEEADTRRAYSWEVRELLMERKRIRLLGSEVAEERQMGEEMVTPASIFASRGAGDRELSPPEFSSELAKMPSGGASKNATVQREEERLVKAALGEEDLGVEDGDIAAEADEADEAVAEETEKTATKKKPPKKWVAPVQVWFPLTFPEKPAKGDLDISTLKDSLYFFC